MRIFYSSEFKKKVIETLAEKNWSLRKAATHFSVGRSSIKYWLTTENKYIPKRTIKKVAKEQFNTTVKELMRHYSNEGVTYLEASNILGFSRSSIQDACYKYGLRLTGRPISKQLKTAIKNCNLRSECLDKLNFLYRKWPTTGLWFNLA